MRPEIKPILEELKREFEAIYGDRLVKMILFGSQARGDAEPNSDIDVLVVLRGRVDPYEETRRTSEARCRLSLAYVVVVGCTYVSEEQLKGDPWSLLVNAELEGVPI